MRHVANYILILIAFATSAFGYGAVQDFCSQPQQVLIAGAQSIAPYLRTFPACTVTVYLNGTGTLATLYDDNDGTPKSNPFIGGATGYWEFWVDDGQFQVVMTGGGIVGTIPRIYTIAGSALVNVSVTPTPNGIPQANGAGIINSGWIFLEGSASIAPGAVTDGSCKTLSTTVTVTGATVGMQAIAAPSTALATGLYPLAKVTSTNVATIQVCNFSGGEVTPPTATYTVAVLP